MYCSKCGKQIPDDAQFCMFCGEKIVYPQYDSVPIEIKDDTNIAVNQDTLSNQSRTIEKTINVEEKSTLVEEKKEKGKRVPIVALIILAVLSLLVGIPQYYKKISQTKKSVEQKETPWHFEEEVDSFGDVVRDGHDYLCTQIDLHISDRNTTYNMILITFKDGDSYPMMFNVSVTGFDKVVFSELYSAKLEIKIDDTIYEYPLAVDAKNNLFLLKDAKELIPLLYASESDVRCVITNGNLRYEFMFPKGNFNELFDSKWSLKMADTEKTNIEEGSVPKEEEVLPSGKWEKNTPDSNTKIWISAEFMDKMPEELKTPATEGVDCTYITDVSIKENASGGYVEFRLALEYSSVLGNETEKVITDGITGLSISNARNASEDIYTLKLVPNEDALTIIDQKDYKTFLDLLATNEVLECTIWGGFPIDFKIYRDNFPELYDYLTGSGLSAGKKTGSVDNQNEEELNSDNNINSANNSFDYDNSQFYLANDAQPDFKNCLNPNDYLYYNSGIADFAFAYPDFFFHDVNTVKDNEQTYLGMDGKIVESDLLKGGDEAELECCLFEYYSKGSIEEIIEHLVNFCSQRFYDCNVVSNNATDSEGKLVLTGWYSEDKSVYAYELFKIDKTYVYSLSFTTASFKNEEDRLQKSYTTENIYRMCKFSGSAEKPRSYEEFLAGENATASINGQIFYDSDSRILSERDVSALSKEQVRYAINEIYARHGYKFADDELYDYYLKQDWYKPTDISMSEIQNQFNSFEKKNIELLSKYR